MCLIYNMWGLQMIATVLICLFINWLQINQVADAEIYIYIFFQMYVRFLSKELLV